MREIKVIVQHLLEIVKEFTRIPFYKVMQIARYIVDIMRSKKVVFSEAMDTYVVSNLF